MLPENWKSPILYILGAWNLVGGATALLDPSRHFAQLYTTTLNLADPLQAFFFRATWINVAAWGIGYILAGRYPGARVPVLAAGGAGKLAYFGACLALGLSGTGRAALVAFGALDVVIAAFFAYILWVEKAGKTVRV